MRRRPILACALLAVASSIAFAAAGAASSAGSATAAKSAGTSALTVYAASSLTNVLNALGTDFERRTGTPVKFSYAASSVLARQIEAGSQADAFVSADEAWMDYLATRGRIRTESRADVAANRLVLVAPADSTVQLRIAPGFALAAALGRGRLATGDPATVPVGRYARAALTTLGVWSSVEAKVVGADNVRSALAFVSRGEAPLGIVYATDARIEPRVRVVDTFPAHTHPPIRYPAALLKTSQPGAAAFVAYLRSAEGQAIFAKHGFLPTTGVR